MKKIIFNALIVLFSFSLHGQLSQPLLDYSTGILANKVEKISTNGKWLYFKEDSDIEPEDLILNHKIDIGLVNGIDLERDSELSFSNGRFQNRYHQTYEGIPVVGGILIEHFKDCLVTKLQGNIHEGIDLNIKPSISDNEALNISLAEIGADTYVWQLDEENDSPPQGKLVIIKNNATFHLAWFFSIQSISPQDVNHVYIDAQNGNIIKSFSGNYNNGSANTVFHGNQDLDTEWRGGWYQDWVLRAEDGERKIVTKRGIDGRVWIETFQVDNDDANWGNNEQRATSVHWAITKSWDYFKSKHDIGGPLNNDKKIRVFAERPFVTGARFTPGPGSITTPSSLNIDIGYNNQWNSNDEFDEDQATWQGSFDVAAHEYAHAMVWGIMGGFDTDVSNHLLPRGEQGAIGESIADIYGCLIEAWATNEEVDWLIGEDVEYIFPDGGTTVRSLSDPRSKSHTEIPDVRSVEGLPETYEGDGYLSIPENEHSAANDNGGIHINCGVHNKWFYLLAEGGTQNNITVSGIGIDKAESILFDNIQTHLMNGMTYSDQREGTTQSAIDIFGECSQEHKSVTNAWAAVGVGSILNSCVTIEGPSNFCLSALPKTYHAVSSESDNTFIWSFPNEWDVDISGQGDKTFKINSLNGAGSNVPFSDQIVVTSSNGSSDDKTINILDCIISDHPCVFLDLPKIGRRTAAEKYSIYPNPANDIININGLTESESTEIKIFNISGKLVLKTIILEEDNTLNISNLAAGIYFVSINNKSSNEVKQIVKL